MMKLIISQTSEDEAKLSLILRTDFKIYLNYNITQVKL